MKRLLPLFMILLVSAASGQQFSEYSGRITDGSTRAKLSFASVQAKGTNIAVVSNNDGEFLIKIPADIRCDSLQISYIGYHPKTVSLDGLLRDANIRMEPYAVAISNITVRSMSASEMALAALSRISANYADKATEMTGFYREFVKRDKRYIGIAEAVLRIYKAPYSGVLTDASSVYKGRKGNIARQRDTLFVKYQGGVATALLIDAIKNSEEFFTESPLAVYNFVYDDPIMDDNRLLYVISFDQKPSAGQILYRGKLYIEPESLAITRIDVNMNVENAAGAAEIFVRQRPAKLSITPLSARYVITYRQSDGKWSLNSSQAEVVLRCKWDKRRFNADYTLVSELAITDIIPENKVKKIPLREQISYNDILSDKITSYEDTDFWGQYNIIEPEQSIETIIKRLRRQLSE